jgi:hypothetical protein
MTDTRVVFSAPGMSRAQLMDLLGGVAARDPRVRVADPREGGALDADPATVALIGAVGLMLVELIRSATQVYLERKKAEARKAESPPQVQVVVHFTLGGRRSVTVQDAEQIGVLLADLPADPAEIRRVQLR